MKSYYSITLVTVFAIVMSIMVIVNAGMTHSDLSAADGAVVALAIGMGILTYRLSQAEKRIAHLENRLEENCDKQDRENRKHAHAKSKETEPGEDNENDRNL